MGGKRGFGQVAKLPSGRHRARYTGPDLALHNAPNTFDNRMDAEAWLTDERRLISAGVWTSPAARRAAVVAVETSRVPLFESYASRWIEERRVKGRPLAPRTRDHYRQLLEDYLSPAFGQTSLDAITPGAVNIWFDDFTPSRSRSHGKKTGGETARAHAYSLARAVMNTATGAHGPIVGMVNPFAVRGGGSAPKRRRDDHVASGAQLALMLDTIRPEWRALVLLATWTGLRYSEVVALRRSDIDVNEHVVRVRKSVSRSRSDGIGLKGPKSDAGVRDVHIPDHVMPDIRTHLRSNVTERDGLLFPGPSGGFLAPATFYGKPNRAGTWYAARTAAGVPSLHFHDLRATGATLMAQLGATEAEIQAFLGDSTPAAAQRYVRAARSRMKNLAARMSELAASGDW
ncbi:tyrosine-type recombinase/integrase [Nocardioides zeicaulis]